jgi:SulP family sulfate permease
MSEAKHFVYILQKAPRADRVILMITFVLTVFADLVVAVNVGVIVAILHFVRRMARAVETKAMDVPALRSELAEYGLTDLPQDVLVYEITGPMFFGAVENFVAALHQTHTDPKTLIMRLRRVPFIDITGIQAMQEVIDDLHKRNMRVLLCEANALVHGKLRTAGVVTEQDASAYANTFREALKKADLRPQVLSPAA